MSKCSKCDSKTLAKGLCRRHYYEGYAKAYYAKNREREIAKAKQRYRDNREKRLEQAKLWAIKNRERKLANNRACVARNPEAARKVIDAWRSANRDVIATYGAKRRTAKAKSTGSHSAEDIRKLKIRQRSRCAACEVSLDKYDVDHIMPLALGGTNDIGNIQLLCRTCNRQKRAKHPIEFMQSRGYLL